MDGKNNTVQEKTQKVSGANKFAKIFEKIVPDSLTVAFILLILVAILAVIFAGAPIFVSTDAHKSVADSMAANFWNLLTFSMQMCLVSILGNVLAMSPPVRKALKKLCQLPNSTFAAYVLCAAIGFVLSFFHWAIGMMGSIVIGKEMLVVARDKGIKIHVPSFVACLFSVGLVGWSGIAASPVLYASTPGYLKTLVDSATAANMKDMYTLRDTVLYAKPMITVALSGLVCFIAIMALRPKKGSPIEEITDEQYREYSIDVNASKVQASTFAQKMSNSIILQYIIVVLMAYTCISQLMKNGIVGLSLNSYNYIILCAALACCMRPRIFTALVVDTVSSVWGFIVQYPIYAAIFGVIVGTGLDKVIANLFLSIATTRTWPTIAMLYSGFMNIFVPSGGSKFIIEAPYIVPVSQTLHVPVETVIMAYSYGDCGTNMLTPFWWIVPCAMFKIDLHKVFPYALVGSLCTVAFGAIALLFW